MSAKLNEEEFNASKVSRQGKRGGKGERRQLSAVGSTVRLFFLAVAWTTATKRAQSAGISEPCAISRIVRAEETCTHACSCISAHALGRSRHVSARAAVFLVSYVRNAFDLRRLRDDCDLVYSRTKEWQRRSAFYRPRLRRRMFACYPATKWHRALLSNSYVWTTCRLLALLSINFLWADC